MSNQAVWRCSNCGRTIISSVKPGYCTSCGSQFPFEKVSDGDGGTVSTGGGFLVDIFLNIFCYILGVVLGIVIMLLQKSAPILWKKFKNLANIIWTKIHSSAKEDGQAQLL